MDREVWLLASYSCRFPGRERTSARRLRLGRQRVQLRGFEAAGEAQLRRLTVSQTSVRASAGAAGRVEVFGSSASSYYEAELGSGTAWERRCPVQRSRPP